MDAEERAKSIITGLGGNTNINSIEHCSTRLRVKVNDVNDVDSAALKKIKGVLAVRIVNSEVQLIVGQNVDQVYDELQKGLVDKKLASPVALSQSVSNDKSDSKSDISNKINSVKTKNKSNIFVRGMNALADCFVPLIPILIGAGLMQAVVTLIKYFNWLPQTGSTYKILYIMSQAPFYFIGIMLAFTVAERFKVNRVMTAGVVAVTLYPTLASLATKGSQYTSYFGIPIRLVTYSSAIVPVFLIVLIQHYYEPLMKKIVPKILSTWLSPLLEFFILSSLTLIILGPISGYISDALSIALNFLVHGQINWLIDMILGGTMILLISTGLHYSLMPVVIANFAMFHYDTFFGCAGFASNMALAGAVIGYGFITKNSKDKQVAFSTGFTALMGITEPAIFGVVFVHRKVLGAALAAGAIAGFVGGLLGVNAYGMAPAGLGSIAVLVGPTFINAIIMIVLAMVLGFVFSILFNKKSMKLSGKSVQNA
ncbi:PTS transporter subunit EIIC [Lactobacillus crispatus]|uniref:PTS transporter subunit EIIC n=1 Tax=Lactobacillus crispatus TaxID=47770 RepID=UPI0018E36C05|nr:PTS transporter subunit EIIC [Lactobacillus crispatus]MBI1704757.1 PTS sugar transporter subunit IIBC [Lactobacillus crispatus]